MVGLLPTRIDTSKVFREVCRATRSAVHRSKLSCGVLGQLPAGITEIQMHSVATLHSIGCLRAGVAHTDDFHFVYPSKCRLPSAEVFGKHQSPHHQVEAGQRVCPPGDI